MSNIYFRYFDIRMASAVTTNGQVCIRGVSKYLNDKISIISNVYSDTDSIFISLEEVVNRRFKDKNPTKKQILDFILKFDELRLQPIIKEFFSTIKENFNCRDMTIRMEAECIGDTSIFTGKKRYVLNKLWNEGVFYEVPKLKITGIEIVRTSTPMWVRNKLKDAINLLFSDCDNEKMISFINNCEKEFNELKFEDIAFTMSANIGEYTLSSKSLPINVRAALKYNQALEKFNLEKKYKKIYNGNKVKFCYLETPNVIQSNIIACPEKMPKEIINKLKIDYKTQFNKTFLVPMERILIPIGWSTKETNSLEDFFS